MAPPVAESWSDEYNNNSRQYEKKETKNIVAELRNVFPAALEFLFKPSFHFTKFWYLFW